MSKNNYYPRIPMGKVFLFKSGPDIISMTASDDVENRPIADKEESVMLGDFIEDTSFDSVSGVSIVSSFGEYNPSAPGGGTGGGGPNVGGYTPSTGTGGYNPSASIYGTDGVKPGSVNVTGTALEDTAEIT